MRDDLGTLIGQVNNAEYNTFLMTTVDTLNWVLGDQMTVEDDIFKVQNDIRELQDAMKHWDDVLKRLEQELK